MSLKASWRLLLRPVCRPPPPPPQVPTVCRFLSAIWTPRGHLARVTAGWRPPPSPAARIWTSLAQHASVKWFEGLGKVATLFLLCPLPKAPSLPLDGRLQMRARPLLTSCVTVTKVTGGGRRARGMAGHGKLEYVVSQAIVGMNCSHGGKPRPACTSSWEVKALCNYSCPPPNTQTHISNCFLYVTDSVLYIRTWHLRTTYRDQLTVFLSGVHSKNERITQHEFLPKPHHKAYKIQKPIGNWIAYSTILNLADDIDCPAPAKIYFQNNNNPLFSNFVKLNSA